jgi:uncharacterized phage-associated protein
MSITAEFPDIQRVQQVPTNAFAVANWFLDAAEKEGNGLTLAKLQKFVYLAYGWYFAYYDEPLFNETILATPSGPIVPALTSMFKDCGKKPIKRRAEIFRDDKIEVLKFSIRLSDESLTSLSNEERDRRKELEQRIVDVLTVVWKSYSALSYEKLMNMMYRPDSPIGKIFDRLGSDIHNVAIAPEAIRNYFKELSAQYPETDDDEIVANEINDDNT